MYIVSGVVIFFLLWWTVIFVTLPFGNARIVADRAREHGGRDGHASSAPLIPHMGRKVIATTMITIILWYPAYWAFRHELGILRNDARQMSIDDDAAGPDKSVTKPIVQDKLKAK
mgnify:CR=1 FL=1